MKNKKPVKKIGPYLLIKNNYFYCSQCGKKLGPSSKNYKNYTKIKEFPLNKTGDKFPPPDQTPFLYREFFCPECGIRFDMEITEKNNPILWDIQLTVK